MAVQEQRRKGRSNRRRVDSANDSTEGRLLGEEAQGRTARRWLVRNIDSTFSSYKRCAELESNSL